MTSTCDTDRNTWSLALRFLRKRKRTGRAEIAKLHESLDAPDNSTSSTQVKCDHIKPNEQLTSSNENNLQLNGKITQHKPLLILKMINSPSDSLLSPYSQMIWNKLQASPKRYNSKVSRKLNLTSCIHEKYSTPSKSISNDDEKFITDDGEKENTRLTPVSRSKRTTLI